MWRLYRGAASDGVAAPAGYPMHDQIEDRKRARMTARHVGADSAEAAIEREEGLSPPGRRIMAGAFVAAVFVGIAVAIWLLG